MIPIDPNLAQRAARRLTAGVEAPNAYLADERFFRMIRWAARSPRNTNAFFAAVQMLRDLGTIDRAEAAYLLSELFDDLMWDEIGRDDAADPGLARAVLEGVDSGLILAAIADRDRARAAAWYRERGEVELADLVLDRVEDHLQLCAEGRFSLLDEKPQPDLLEVPLESAAPDPRLAERVLALSATESFREWYQAWSELCDAMRHTPSATAVPAIRGLRDVGGISFDESLVLIDLAIDDDVSNVLAADREYYRLQRELEEVERQLGISYDDGIRDEARPPAWQALRQRLDRRIDGQTAVVLRRFGEHRMANLLIANPAEYARIRDHARIGQV